MKKWTDDEKAKLELLYPDQSNTQEYLVDLFGREWEAIKGVAKRMKLKRGNRIKTSKWSDDDLNLLRKLYPDISLSTEEISEKMDRTWSSIANMAHRLNLSRENSNYWSQENVDKLKLLYEDKTISKQQLQDNFPNQSLQSIYTKAFEMGLSRKWSDEEIKILKEIYELEETTDEILLEKLTGRTIDGINYKANYFKLKRYSIPSEIYWTKEEIDLLLKVFPDDKIPKEKIISMFKRSWESIRKKAFLLDIKRGKIENKNMDEKYQKQLDTIYKSWNSEDIEYLKKSYSSESSLDICKKLNKSWTYIKKCAKSLGLSRNRKKYHVDDSYFDVINTNEKAYWLGFISADGSVSKNIQFVLVVHKKDLQILIDFKNAIAPDAEIKQEIRKSRNYYILRLSSRELVEKLGKYNIISRKTYNFEWPNELPEEYYIPFIIGYFDGDGCLSYNNQNKKWQWYILGKEKILEKMRQILIDKLKIHIPEAKLVGCANDLHKLLKSGSDVEKINDLFVSYNIGLERKRIHGYGKIME